MDSLLASLAAAAFAEIGDKTQLLTVALAIRFGRALPILLGILIAASLNSVIAAAGGMLVQDIVAPRASLLLVALALAFAGLGNFIPAKESKMARSGRTGPFLTALFGFFILGLGDKTQFVTFALAARYENVAFVAGGAALGIFAANLPAAVLGREFLTRNALAGLRYAIGGLFLLSGAWAALQALRLA